LDAQVIIDTLSEGWSTWKDHCVVTIDGAQSTSRFELLVEPSFQVEGALLYITTAHSRSIWRYNDISAVHVFDADALKKHSSGQYL
jgi:hypothetical protein